MQPGTYLLLIRLPVPARITVGRLGEVDFPRGWYVYCGSAMRGIEARVARHRRRQKRLHWHIDFLLAHPATRLAAWRTFPSRRRLECHLNRRVLALPGARQVAPGFGASDCTHRCGSHLSWFPVRPNLDSISLDKDGDKR